MTINRLPHGDGLTFSLDSSDFKLDRWRGFLEAVKRIGGEYDGETKAWSIPEVQVEEFYRLKREYFDDVIHKDQRCLF